MIMRIKELRETAGLHQKNIAEQMGVLQSAVSNWETGVSLPKARQLPVLAKVLGCTIDELFAVPDGKDYPADEAEGDQDSARTGDGEAGRA